MSLPKNVHYPCHGDNIPLTNEYYEMNVWNPDIVEKIWKCMEKSTSGPKIKIGFVHFPANRTRRNHNYNHPIIYTEYSVISAADFGNDIVHSELFFGEEVCSLGVGSWGMGMRPSPPEEKDIWEFVSVPFKDQRKAFEIALDIIKRTRSAPPSTQHVVSFSSHVGEMLEHFLCRLFFKGHGVNDFDCKGDYDPMKPEEWVRGMHCSQIVLLFLKRCILEDVIRILPKHKVRFLSAYSFTCLPSGLLALIKETWPKEAPSEIRDYITDQDSWVDRLVWPEPS